MYKVGDTVLVLPLGYGVVERVLPSGSAVIRDCLGYAWLVGMEQSYAERVPLSLQRGLTSGEVAEMVPPPLVRGRTKGRISKKEEEVLRKKWLELGRKARRVSRRS